MHITTFFPEKVNVKLIYLVGVRICWYQIQICKYSNEHWDMDYVNY